LKFHHKITMVSSTSHNQSFLLGVGAALSAVFAAHLFQQQQERQKRTSSKPKPNVPPRTSTVTAWSAVSPVSETDPIVDSPDLDLRLIRKAEAVIQGRTSSVTVVVERCTNDHNYSAILRTVEALGIQNVWIVDPPAWTELDGDGHDNADSNDNDNLNVNRTGTKLTLQEIEQRQTHRLFAQNATEWLTLREFANTADCVKALKETGHEIWATDLSQLAVPLTSKSLQQVSSESNGNIDCWPLPRKLAIVFGTEAVGCSQEILEKADLRVYLPLRGFADSLNLSVATALMVHQLFVLEPSLMGSMSEPERNELRTAWFSKLARQRLLSKGDKKRRIKLLGKIENCKQLQAKIDAGIGLDKGQIVKAQEGPHYEKALRELEEAANYSHEAAERAVSDLILHPPAPLSDLRRADVHRVSFVGKKTKRLHQDHWKDMAATANAQTVEKSTAAFFRERMASLSTGDNNGDDDDNKNNA
jgi:tRNA G18 (ribose-2'-O)-methylase SpoU